jgi:predicted RNA methylase
VYEKSKDEKNAPDVFKKTFETRRCEEYEGVSVPLLARNLYFLIPQKNPG